MKTIVSDLNYLIIKPNRLMPLIDPPLIHADYPKLGFQIYNKIIGIILSLFGLTLRLRIQNKIWYVNKKSLKNWIEREKKVYHLSHHNIKTIDQLISQIKLKMKLKTPSSCSKSPFSFFMPEKKIDDQGIISMNSDGNCLFNALVEGLRFFNRNIPDNFTHKDLREKVSTWIKLNYDVDELLHIQVAFAIEEHVTKQLQLINEQLQTFKALKHEGLNVDANILKLEMKKDMLRDFDEIQYFAAIKKDHFFGSSPIIHAVSKIYNLSIKVIQNKGNPLIFNESCPQQVCLNYTGDHYNLLIEKY